MSATDEISRAAWQRSGPGLPSPTGLPSMRTTGMTVLRRRGDEGLRAPAWPPRRVNGRSTELDALPLRARSISVVRVTPRRMAVSIWRVMTAPVLVDDPGVGRRALGDEAVVVDEPGLARALACAPPPWRATVGSSITVLMSQRRPADVGHGLDGDARCRSGLLRRRPRRGARQARRRSAGASEPGTVKSRGRAPRVTCR